MHNHRNNVIGWGSLYQHNNSLHLYIVSCFLEYVIVGFYRYPFSFRVVWLCVVLASLIFFVVEVGIRSTEYLKHETNIDIELMFVEKMPFPAVTICNQNSYRLTKAVELDLYHFIDEMYMYMADERGGKHVEFISMQSLSLNISLSSHFTFTVTYIIWEPFWWRC